MSDPAIEAAARVWDGDPQQLAHNLVAAAREALKPIRQMHRPVNAHGSGRIVCGVCWDSMSNYVPWPCATAKLIYTTEELS